MLWRMLFHIRTGALAHLAVVKGQSYYICRVEPGLLGTWLMSSEWGGRQAACIRSGKSVEEFCDRIRTTDNPDECPVVADFRAFPRRWLLTVAHLNHIPGDCAHANLKAFCNPCHCRYDLQQMSRKQLLKRERHGQLRIKGI